MQTTRSSTLNQRLVSQHLSEVIDVLDQDLPKIDAESTMPFPSLSPEQFDSLISSW